MSVGSDLEYAGGRSLKLCDAGLLLQRVSVADLLPEMIASMLNELILFSTELCFILSAFSDHVLSTDPLYSSVTR